MRAVTKLLLVALLLVASRSNSRGEIHAMNCQAPLDRNVIRVTVDTEALTVIYEWVGLGTGTHCREKWVNGAYAPLFIGASADWCSPGNNERRHQIVRIDGDIITAASKVGVFEQLSNEMPDSVGISVQRRQMVVINPKVQEVRKYDCEVVAH
jgi:hypothetical protein